MYSTSTNYYQRSIMNSDPTDCVATTISDTYVPSPKEEELLKRLEMLKQQHQKELDEAKKQARREAFAAKVPTIKISTKGCVQINGIRRFPITLYKNEWEKIFDILPDIKLFIKTNDEQLASI